MYSGGTFPVTPGQGDTNRPAFSHSLSHSHLYNQQYTVAGMPSQGAAGSPSMRGGPLSGSTSLSPMGDSLTQSRSHYQSGYLMSASQNNAGSPSSQRHDDLPLVQTKAKMNTILSGAPASDFGVGSMFETSRERQRQSMADEDAPPTNSVNDIVNEVFTDAGPSRRQLQSSTFDSPARSMFRPSQSQAPSTPKPATSTSTPLYVVVFGYPPDKYSAAVEYFRSLGETTEPDQNTEITNCFRLGYLNPTHAMRAVRKSGDILHGSWMVGVKFADPSQAENMLGSSLVRTSQPFSSPEAGPSTPDVPMSISPPRTPGFTASPDALALTTNVQRTPATPAVGTPFRVAPATSAFRKAGAGTPSAAKKPGSAGPATPAAVLNQSPSKGMLGQVSDLIFGW